TPIARRVALQAALLNQLTLQHPAESALDRLRAADDRGARQAQCPSTFESTPASGPRDSVASSSRSDAASSKSKTARLSRMRAGLADFGIATSPCCTCQRSTTCAGV